MIINMLCLTCEHLKPEKRIDFNYFCDAFPDGIPDPIKMMKFDHHKPYKGDHGIQYKKESRLPKIIKKVIGK
jgi:hypothetical protein